MVYERCLSRTHQKCKAAGLLGRVRWSLETSSKLHRQLGRFSGDQVKQAVSRGSGH